MFAFGKPVTLIRTNELVRDACSSAAEKAINIGTFRQSAATWKLSNDADVRRQIYGRVVILLYLQLLQYLKSFSEALIRRTKDVEQQVETLVYDTKTMDVRVHNSFNRFVLLSNTQYIENVSYSSSVAGLLSLFMFSVSTKVRIRPSSPPKRSQRMRARSPRMRRR